MIQCFLLICLPFCQSPYIQPKLDRFSIPKAPACALVNQHLSQKTQKDRATNPQNPVGKNTDKVKDSTPKTKTVTAPFLLEKLYLYHWHLDGKIIGSTKITMTKKKGVIDVGSEWKYDARGRKFSATANTLFNENKLEFRSFAQTTTVSIGPSVFTTSTHSTNNQEIVGTRYVAGSKVYNTRKKWLPSHLIYGLQAFEHVVLFAKHAQQNSFRPLNLFQPHSGDTLTATFKKLPLETGANPAYSKVEFKAEGVEATLWIDSKGLLVAYKQGELTVYLDGVQLNKK